MSYLKRSGKSHTTKITPGFGSLRMAEQVFRMSDLSSGKTILRMPILVAFNRPLNVVIFSTILRHESSLV